MEKTGLEMILLFTIFSFLLIFPFQLTMAQVVTETVSGKIPSTTPPGTPPGATPSPKPGTTNGTTLCSVSDYTIVTVPLQQLKNNFRGLNVTVSGTVSIIDGCTFEVTGFTYSFAATST